MFRLVRVGAVVALSVLAALATTCSDTGSVLPTTPTLPAVTGVEIQGPDTLAPGASAAYTAIVHFADGTSKAASADTPVIWRSSGPNIQVDADGQARAFAAGEAVLMANIRSRGTAQKEVVVVPEGTYRMVGVISDAEFPDLRIFGARVEVTPGPFVVTTGVDGAYRMYGVPPDAELRVTADGYEPAVRRVHLTAHSTEDVRLVLPGPRLGLSGAYTLRIDTTASCSSLPEDLQHREYGAVLTQDGFRLEVVLTEPEFRIDAAGKGNRFTGVASGRGATFHLDHLDYYYYDVYPSVAEALPDGSTLVVAGVALTTESPGGLSGTLMGDLMRWSFTGLFPDYLGGCLSQPLAFTLTRR